MTISEALVKKYRISVGIECHVQLKTKTKLFSAVANDARDAEPNTLISHIDVGMPGALPVLNKKALELSLKAAFALNAEPQRFSKFDRKHYFYPDLPKGYQITQYDQPIIKGGYVEIAVDSEPKKIRITRVHLEEDAGKSTHPAGANYSLVDLNRAGTPLLEIVSEPDICSASEAKAYARELYLLMKYAEVSDVDLFQGNMRFDVNTSVSASEKLGVRTEVKNLNSFRSVEAAVEHEVERQIMLLEKGEVVQQETRGWDEVKQKTIAQRSKEEAQDYRYMPEPDIPPIELEEKYVSKIAQSMPPLPSEFRLAFKELEIDSSVIEGLVIMSPHTAQLTYGILKNHGVQHATRFCSWLIHSYDLLEKNMIKPSARPIDEESILKLSDMVSKNIISARSGREIFVEMFQGGEDPLAIAKKRGSIQDSDEVEIEKVATETIKENPKAAQDVKNGEMKAIGFLVGQLMAKSKGTANPALAQKIIKKILGVS